MSHQHSHNAAAKPETMKTKYGLKAIRRKNPTGYHYFIANLSPNDIHDHLPLAVSFKDAVWFNPLNGDIIPASISADSIDICLRSGESMILQTYDSILGNPRNSRIPRRLSSISRKQTKKPLDKSSGIFLSILFELFLITQLQCYQQQQQCQQQ